MSYIQSRPEAPRTSCELFDELDAMLWRTQIVVDELRRRLGHDLETAPGDDRPTDAGDDS